jgi:NADH-quinone oxidoreductase subunit J
MGLIMTESLFYLFAAAALGSGALVVFKRDPMISAISLIVTLCNVAAIYLCFGAGFLAAVQVIVYAGAVMVLFLFIIMLLPSGTDLEHGTGRFRGAVIVASLLFTAEFLIILVQTIPKQVGEGFEGQVTISSIGALLFGPFLVPFEIVSFLLLVAVVGVVMLAGSNKNKEQGSEIK